MFEYITEQEAAKKWNVSVRWVQRLCKEKRIDGIININRVWLIPKEAGKPTDGRYRKSGDVDES
jgi:4-alpha-glucanotransferase